MTMTNEEERVTMKRRGPGKETKQSSCIRHIGCLLNVLW